MVSDITENLYKTRKEAGKMIRMWQGSIFDMEPAFYPVADEEY